MENRINRESPGTETNIGKVAIYCRVASTSLCDAGKIYKQLAQLRNFAKQRGFDICAEYLDDGFSGNNLNRPAFFQMEADINLGKVDTVIVSCIDRIARNMFIMEKWISDSKEKGVRIIALDGSDVPPSSLLKSFKHMHRKRKVTKQ